MTVALSNGLTQTRHNISSTDFEIEFDSIGTTTSYTATVTLSDTIGTIKTWSLTVSTVDVPFDINVNLPGLACGTVAETKKALEFAEGWKLKFGSYPMMDFVVEQGSIGIWRYRKWASGVAECWAKITQTVTPGDISEYTLNLAPYYIEVMTPIDFTIINCVNASVYVGNGHTITSSVSATLPNKIFIPALSVYLTGQQECKAYVYVMGRWK